MAKRTQSQSVCAGPIKRAPVGDAVVRGSGNRSQSGGTGQYNGVGGSGDPAAPAFAKQNNCSGEPKNT